MLLVQRKGLQNKLQQILLGNAVDWTLSFHDGSRILKQTAARSVAMLSVCGIDDIIVANVAE